MSWIVSLLVAIVSGLVSLFLTGTVANACVTWCRIPSREGAAGYFVIFNALLGGLAGTILGLIVARVIASHIGPSFVTELGGSLSVIFLVAGIAGIDGSALAMYPDDRRSRSDFGS
ncbi:MAG: hypothetical protein R3C03_04760 [Pirellulaceae bacterium]